MKVELIDVETGQVTFEREVQSQKIAKNVHDLVKDVIFLMKDEKLTDSVIQLIFNHDFNEPLVFEQETGVEENPLLFRLTVWHVTRLLALMSTALVI